MNLTKLKAHPRTFSNLFGIDPEKFDELVIPVTPIWQKAEVRRLAKLPSATANQHKIKKGSGRP